MKSPRPPRSDAVPLPENGTGYLRDRDTLKKVLAGRLRAALDQNGWSLGDAANAASRYLPEGWNLRRAHLSDYTRARHLPGPRYLVALAKALRVEPWELLEGEPTGPPAGEWRKLAATRERSAESVQVLDLGSEAWLDIRRRVPWPTALEVLRMLKDRRGEMMSNASQPDIKETRDRRSVRPPLRTGS
jgi:transcriptional regulator with XRE-family HTH domain